MKRFVRLTAFGVLATGILMACSSPTVPRFPDNPDEDEDPADPDTGDEKAFLDLHFQDEAFLA